MSVKNEKVLSIFYIPLKTFLKICIIILLIVLIFMQFINFLGIGTSLKLNENYIKNETNIIIIKEIKKETKNILYWTKMFNDKTFYLGEGDIFKECEVSECRATWNRSLMKIDEFDALLFHGIQISKSEIPLVRSTKQKYIFVDLESPITLQANVNPEFNEFYNWTMTYRRDSDIPRAYGYIVDSITKKVVYPIWAGTNSTKNLQEIYKKLGNTKTDLKFKGPRKTVAWFVSHCNTNGRRDDYVAELEKYIDVDIYGKCGTLSCPTTNDKQCYDMLDDKYYFYLSFENSLCKDYVTEKLYKILNHEIIPIVYGASNYTEFALPGSYINVLDFKSPKYLADYLRYLIENFDEYSKFFWWKKYFSIDLSHRVSICEMCRLLHDKKKFITSTNISNLNQWWFEFGKCLNPDEFLKNITMNE